MEGGGACCARAGDRWACVTHTCERAWPQGASDKLIATIPVFIDEGVYDMALNPALPILATSSRCVPPPHEPWAQSRASGRRVYPVLTRCRPMSARLVHRHRLPAPTPSNCGPWRTLQPQLCYKSSAGTSKP